MPSYPQERKLLAGWAAVWLLSASLLASLIGLQHDAAAVLIWEAEAEQAQPPEPSRPEGPEQPQQPAKAAYADDRLVVDYEDTVEQCVHCLLKARGRFRDATADRSDSLDQLHARFGVSEAKPVFRTEEDERRLGTGRLPVAALRQHHRDRIEAVKAPRRTRKSRTSTMSTSSPCRKVPTSRKRSRPSKPILTSNMPSRTT